MERQATVGGAAVIDLLSALRQPAPPCRAVGVDITSLEDPDARVPVRSLTRLPEVVRATRRVGAFMRASARLAGLERAERVSGSERHALFARKTRRNTRTPEVKSRGVGQASGLPHDGLSMPAWRNRRSISSCRSLSICSLLSTSTIQACSSKSRELPPKLRNKIRGSGLFITPA
jgi:hypothetical protein